MASIVCAFNSVIGVGRYIILWVAVVTRAGTLQRTIPSGMAIIGGAFQRSLINKGRWFLGPVPLKRFTSNQPSTRQGPQPAYNRTLAGEPMDPWHGSYHWLYERGLSVASLGLLGAAFLVPGKMVDLALGVVIPLHCHIGFAAIITDYLPKRKFGLLYPLARAVLIAATAGTIYGLYRYNTKEVGICEGVSRLWRAKIPRDSE